MLQAKGKITVWKDDKGFGFIKPEDGIEQVFVHISAFGKILRRPNVGDTVFYELAIEKNGKKKASNAHIEGVQSVKKPDHKVRFSRRERSRFNWLGYITIIIIGGLILYKNPSFIELSSFMQTSKFDGFKSSESSSLSSSNQYKCSGKTYCSEMTSCEEAKYYLSNCPNVKIDGDGDGIPCESQWCN